MLVCTEFRPIIPDDVGIEELFESLHKIKMIPLKELLFILKYLLPTILVLKFLLFYFIKCFLQSGFGEIKLET